MTTGIEEAIYAATDDRRSERINLRVNSGLDAFLRRAAAIEHKTLSAFLLEAGLEKARAVVEQEQQLQLSLMDFAAFSRALERPAEVIAPLRALAERERVIPDEHQA